MDVQKVKEQSEREWSTESESNIDENSVFQQRSAAPRYADRERITTFWGRIARRREEEACMTM
jgi:hypothetical protein